VTAPSSTTSSRPVSGSSSTWVCGLPTADLRDHETVLAHPEVTRLLDLDEPLAVLFLSVGHHLLDEPDPRDAVHGLMDRTAPGSHVAFSQVVSDDPARGAAQTAAFTAAGIPWRTRTPAEVDALLAGLTPVEPGLVNLTDWRPLDLQPPLAPVPAEIAEYEGAAQLDPSIYEYGGVLVKR
jgi:hypothetical protein